MNYTEFMKDRLRVKVFATREEMGVQAAHEAAQHIRELAARQEEINIIFAAAPSQNDFLSALLREDIPWEKINALHMDEYIGIDEQAPQGFANFLRRQIFDHVPLKSCSLLNCQAPDVDAELARYSLVLRAHLADIAFIGIGENGHIAFNDPSTADFTDPMLVKKVMLEETSRVQQVNDGCFAALHDVPTGAMTVTLPPILAASRIFCIVPCKTKADAVNQTINAPVSPDCPSTVLRTHPSAVLYLDSDAASRL